MTSNAYLLPRFHGLLVIKCPRKKISLDYQTFQNVHSVQSEGVHAPVDTLALNPRFQTTRLRYGNCMRKSMAGFFLVHPILPPVGVNDGSTVSHSGQPLLMVPHTGFCRSLVSSNFALLKKSRSSYSKLFSLFFSFFLRFRTLRENDQKVPSLAPLALRTLNRRAFSRRGRL